MIHVILRSIIYFQKHKKQELKKKNIQVFSSRFTDENEVIIIHKYVFTLFFICVKSARVHSSYGIFLVRVHLKQREKNYPVLVAIPIVGVDAAVLANKRRVVRPYFGDHDSALI